MLISPSFGGFPDNRMEDGRGKTVAIGVPGLSLVLLHLKSVPLSHECPAGLLRISTGSIVFARVFLFA